jgi:scyllo-inositol 2-dehydrogenase (NADP+)
MSRLADGRELRVAMVGYGLAGSTFHRPLIGATPGLRLATVVTRDSARQAQARAQITGVTVVDSAETLWAAPAEHDLVVIVTPTGSHAEIARSAVAAGMPTVVDKPLAATAHEAAEIAALAKASGTFLTVFHNRRWDGDFLTVRNLMRDGDLGAVLRFESRFERWRAQPRAGSWREEQAVAEGGGVLADLGSHVIDQALQLFGRPTAVYAEVDASRPGAVVDDDAFVALEHPMGVRSHLWTSSIASVPAHRMRVLGTAGGYAKDHLDIQEESLRGGADPAAPGWGEEPPDRWGLLVTATGERRIETAAGAWPEFYKEVVSALREGSPPPVEPVSAVEVLEVIEAARESASRRAGVDIPPASAPA